MPSSKRVWLTRAESFRRGFFCLDRDRTAAAHCGDARVKPGAPIGAPSSVPLLAAHARTCRPAALDQCSRRYSLRSQSGCLLLFRQARLRECCEDHEAVKMADDEIRAIVAERLAEQHRLQQANIDAIVLRTVASVLASFGIDDGDRRELRADFQHLRRWRTSVEQAQSYTLKAVITMIATGLMGVVGLSVKVLLGK
jgi:hypothetical protein